MMRRAVLGFCLATLLPLPAHAEYTKAQKALCGPGQKGELTVGRKALLRKFLAESGISEATLLLADPNGTIGEEDLRRPFTSPVSFCLTHLKADDKTCENITARANIAIESLQEFIDAPPKQLYAWAGDKPASVRAYVTAEPPAVLTCLAQSDAPPPSPVLASIKKFRLRGDIEALGIPQEQENAFKAAKAGSLTINSDISSQRRTYDINAVAGIDLGNILDGKPLFGTSKFHEIHLIPFIQYTRHFTTKDAGNHKNDVNNLGIGVSLEGHLPIGTVGNGVSLYPKYVVNTEEGTKVGTMSLSYRPAPNIPFVNSFRPIDQVNLSFRPSLVAVGGKVFEDGGKETVRTNDTFFRAGPRAELALLGVTDGPLEPWSLTTSYRFLRGFQGQHPYLRRFEASLGYDFAPKSATLFGLSLDYAHGRADDTSELEHYYKLGLKVKY